MPLPPPAPRTPMHNRTIECRGYEREDGLWDIEGHLVDTKTFATTARDTGRPRQPGEPVHNMWLRLTIDLDMKIHDAEAATDAGPYAHCGAITPNFKALKGVIIGAGWRRKTLELLGGINGWIFPKTAQLGAAVVALVMGDEGPRRMRDALTLQPFVTTGLFGAVCLILACLRFRRKDF